MTPGEFIAKWRASESKERSTSQEHFIDLCRLLGERRGDSSLVKVARSAAQAGSGSRILKRPWSENRQILLDESDEGNASGARTPSEGS